MKRFLLALTFALSACATSNIANNYVLNNASAFGVAAGSITYEGGYAAYRLHLRNMATGKSYRVEHGSSQTLNLVLAFAGEDPDPELGTTGSAFAVELPAGRYALESWQISQGMADVWSTSPTLITFEVRAGQAVYLGNFHFRETARFARSVTGATVSLTDKSERDLPAIRKAFPAISQVAFLQTLAKGTDIKNVGGKSDGRIQFPIFVPVAR